MRFLGLFRNAGIGSSRPGPVVRLRCEALYDRLALSPIGAAALVNQAVSNPQFGGLVATTRDAFSTSGVGNSLVAWNHQTSPTNHDVRVRVLDRGGAPVGNEIRLASTTADEFAGGVAADARGNFVVCWTEHGTSDPTKRTVHAQRFSATGQLVGGRILVAELRGLNPFGWQSPRVAMAPDGRFVIAHCEPGSNGDTNMVARMYAAGGAFVRSVTVANRSTLAETHPSVGIDASGNFAVAYRVGQVGSGRIELRQFTSAGALVRTVAVTSGTTDSAPSLGMNGAGNMVVAWHDLNGAAPIRARRVAADGTPGTVFDVSTGQFPAYPQVAMNPSGDDFVVGYTNLVVTNGRADHVAKIAETSLFGGMSNFTLAASTQQAAAVLSGVAYRPDGSYLVAFNAGNSADADGGVFVQTGTRFRPVPRPIPIPLPRWPPL